MLHLRVRMEAGRIGERRENLSEKGRRWGHYGASLVGSAIHYCWTNRQKILLDTAWPSHGSRDHQGAVPDARLTFVRFEYRHGVTLLGNYILNGS